MKRDYLESGQVALTDKRVEDLGFKNFAIRADFDKDYVIQWSPSSQSYDMGVRDNKTGVTILFCWDIKFVHELKRLMLGLTGG